MNILSIENLSKSYGTKALFSGLTFGINQGQKIALVAKNGTGKTSLLRIIAGRDTADSGSMVMRKDIRMAYLEQEPLLDHSKNVLQVIFDGDTPELNAIRQYEQCLLHAENADALAAAQHTMDELNCWEYETRARQVLTQLGITDFEQPVAQLSGGQLKRVALAQVLIQEPDFLILDEPTNHLDMEMVEWLENYISSRDFTVLLVTHDRYFLDRVCDEIIEIDNGELVRYKGNFSYYIEKKAEREEMRESELSRAKNLYRRELEWVRKMPRARTTKSKSRVDAFDDIREQALQKRKNEKLEIGVKATRLGGKILELIKLSKTYGSKKILSSFSYTFKSKEKIGIVGKNGTGKSTFLNIILGLEKFDSGKIQLGDTVVFGYYSQKGLVLNEDKRVIEVVKDIGEYIPLADGTKLSASQLLQRFMFTPEMQYTYVSRLSGGEKRRLYLCTVLIKNPNFLILDEPTNDLDIITLSTLEDFLSDFDGCVLIVSHDRYFMDRLAQHLFVFEGDGVVKDFPGNYSQYREWKLGQEKAGKELQAEIKEQKKAAADPLPAKKRLSYNEKRELEQLDRDIPLLESRKKEIEEQLNSGIEDYDKLQSLSDEYKQLLSDLDSKTFRWLQLSELI
ncbi:MAG: ribosomal protection-like ABC-F family protein [Bacteroidota bacterium]